MSRVARPFALALVVAAFIAVIGLPCGRPAAGPDTRLDEFEYFRIVDGSVRAPIPAWLAQPGVAAL